MISYECFVNLLSFKGLITHSAHAAAAELEADFLLSRLRGSYDPKYCCIRSHLKCSPRDSSLSEMDSEEFAITSSITLQSTLVFTGFTAKSCQLIVPHSMASVDICLAVSSGYVECAA